MNKYLMTVDGTDITILPYVEPAAPPPQEGLPTMTRHSRGMILVNSPDDVDHDIIITSGYRMSEDDTADIPLEISIIKRLDSSWSCGSNQGGMEHGSTLTAGGTYHAHAITDGATSDVLFSPSSYAPTLPAGYTARKRLGAVIADQACNIRPFLQTGDNFQFLDAIYDVASVTGNVGTSAKTFTLTVPMGIKVQADLAFQANTLSGFSYLSACDQDLGDAKDNDCIFTFGTSSIILRVPVWTDATRRISVKAGTTATMGIYNRGWVDHREG